MIVKEDKPTIQPLISVIMNCYNSDTYLREAIESVIKQTYTNWELIFWDNQSTDDSAKIIKSYNDPRLRYFYAQDHTTLGSARNLALEKATGEWCGILDCDDIWLPQKIERQVENISNRNDIGVIYSDFNIISIDGRVKRESVKPCKSFQGDIFDKIITEEFTVCWPTVLFNTKALIMVGSFTGFRYLEDFDILLRLAEKYKFVFVNEKLASYRVHSGQSSVNYKIMLEEKMQIFDNWLTTWENQGALSKENRQLLLKKGMAHAYFVAGINAVYYGDSGIKYFIKSIEELYSSNALIGFFLCLMGPKFAASAITRVRKVLGYGEYYG